MSQQRKKNSLKTQRVVDPTRPCLNETMN